MAFSTPGVQLFDSSDTELGTTANPLKSRMTDGTNFMPTADAPARRLYTQLTDGTNSASVSAGGALLVDGSATTQPVSGTVTANAGTGTFNNQQSNVQIDYDTGAGTQNLTVWGIALPASGGAVAGGTSTNPIRTDPTGTTTQPVNGTVTSNQGTPNTLANRWPVIVTDGTNTMPTMDVVTRAGFMKVTDGVDTLAVNADGSINVSISGSGATTYRVDFYQGAVAAKTYYEVIQASNASTDYKHPAGTKIQLHSLMSEIIKSKNADQWDVELGVILTIGGANAKIGWLKQGSMRIRDTGNFQREETVDFTNTLDLRVAAGDFTFIAVGKTETTTDLTTASTIADVKGTLVTPVVGDLIMRVANVGSVTGTILVQQHLNYEVAA